MQEVRRFKPSTVWRRFSVTAGFYRTAVIDGVLDHSPAEHVRRPAVPPESPTLGFTHLQFEAMLTAARESHSQCDFALVAMLGLLGEHGPAHDTFDRRHPDMTSSHTSYEELASQRRDSDEYRQGHAEAQRAYLLGKAVRDRRLALGLSRVELAARAGMTQPALSRLEAGGVIPTIPLLDRISAALDADLIVQIAPHAA